MRIIVNGQLLSLGPRRRKQFFKAIAPHVQPLNVKLEISGTSVAGKIIASENIQPAFYLRKADVMAFILLFSVVGYACLIQAYELIIVGLPIVIYLEHSLKAGVYEVVLPSRIHQKILTLRQANYEWRNEIQIFPEPEPVVTFDDNISIFHADEIDLEMSAK